MWYSRVSGVIGPVAVGLAPGPMLLSEEEEETEPLRAETVLIPAGPIAVGGAAESLDTHLECLHAVRLACRDDLSGKAPSKYQRHPETHLS